LSEIRPKWNTDTVGLVGFVGYLPLVVINSHISTVAQCYGLAWQGFGSMCCIQAQQEYY